MPRNPRDNRNRVDETVQCAMEVPGTYNQVEQLTHENLLLKEEIQRQNDELLSVYRDLHSARFDRE